ncbi:MAG TPA: Hpt domain-containing protein [Planctomycetota bacterium]|nr:Hpt domain-containing protein [Planctomycetota bacterium]
MNQSEDVLDMNVIAALKELGGEGDDSLFRELLDLYVDDSTSQMRRLEESLKSGDLKVAERIAHTLKSSSANLGATTLSQICMQMELRGRGAAPATMSELLGATREEHTRVVKALNALRT